MKNKNIDTVVILAAGKGERISNMAEFVAKPLIKIFDVSLIERSIRNLISNLNIKKIYIVTGFNHEEINDHLVKLKNKLSINIETVFAKDWEKGNGASFLAILDKIKHEQFYLLMADHLFNDEFYKTILKYEINNKSCLIISRTLSSLDDFNDATKVKVVEDKISDIGKSIKDSNGFDTGFFILNSDDFNNVNKLSVREKLSLTEVIQELVQQKKLYFIEVSEDGWFDIDTNKDLLNAKNYLLKNNLSSKTNVGSISKYINRPISQWITSKITDYALTPNQISIAVFFISVFSGLIISIEGYFFLLLGALLAQLSSILDGCDGEIARLKFLESKFGGWFDQVLDRYGDLFILMGLTFHTYFIHKTLTVFFIGFIAVGGKIILSYTAYVYDSKVSAHDSFRIGRDLIIFIILIGALFNIPYITLVVLAFIVNVEVCKRLWMLKDKLDY
ncbi:MAG: sugar phosphate nucleotidyltransferase [Alphaproteobacteria bacterium]|jgi:CDP-L-myo-inositol myo-inositolphosphotransferase|nr:sugar phosphate nucleotidyltransferase [Alphaproteobacteria bacterium]|tara:strand:- start:7185 stop:8525 length:1341 start_codon:yes stop_codon:yes gene_type:complete